MSEILVIANCQCLPIARILSICIPSIRLDFIDVNRYTNDDAEKKISLIEASKDSATVLTFPLASTWGAIATEKLRDRLSKERLLVFTNMHFSGLHPDITYIGKMGSRVGSPFSDYHSKIILYCYLTGRSINDCVSLFNGNTYQSLKFFDNYSIAALELKERDASCDVKIAQPIIDLLHREHSFYTNNHPTDIVLRVACQIISRQAGYNFIDHPSTYFTNTLSENVIWPVYNELAEYHKLSYRTPQHFIKRQTLEHRCLNLIQTVSSFYEAYAKVPISDLLEEVRQLEFFKLMQETLD